MNDLFSRLPTFSRLFNAFPGFSRIFLSTFMRTDGDCPSPEHYGIVPVAGAEPISPEGFLGGLKKIEPKKTSPQRLMPTM